MSNPFPHPLILGHRGAPAEAPENTLASFARALAHGADGVELDVQLSRDGVPVVIHDATLDRTTPARGAVAAHDWPALERLTGATLPSLQQAAAWASGAGAWLNVEIKAPAAAAATLRTLQETGLLGRTLLSSFDAHTVAEVGRIEPAALRFLLAERWTDSVHDELLRCDAQGVCLRVDAADALTLEVLRNENLPVVVWTVNDRARMRDLLRAGVAALITDHPAEGVAARREVGG